MILFLIFTILWGVLLFEMKERKVKPQVVWLTLGSLFLYWGFSYTNAPDTEGYMDFFDMLSTSGWVLDSLYGSAAGGMEPGTFILMQLCKKVSSSYYFFQAVILLIDLLLSFWGLKKLLGDKEQPTLFFLLFAFCTPMFLAAMRQGVAIAIMIFCLPLFRDNKYYFYVPLIILAIFFHQSAILFFAIPVAMWVAKKVRTSSNVGCIIVFSIFVVCNICYLFGISAGVFIERYLGGFVYDSSMSTSREMSFAGATEESNFGILKVLEMDVCYLIFFFSKKDWKSDAHNYMGAFFLVFFILNMLVGGIIIHRLSYYLRIPYYFVLYESLRYMFRTGFKWNFRLANLAIFVYMLSLFVIQDLSGGKYVFEYHLFELF